MKTKFYKQLTEKPIKKDQPIQIKYQNKNQ